MATVKLSPLTLKRIFCFAVLASFSCDRSSSTSSSTATTRSATNPIVRQWDFSKSHKIADVPFPPNSLANARVFFSVPVNGKVRVIFDKDHIFEDTVTSVDFVSGIDGTLVGVDFFYASLDGDPVEKSTPFAKTFNLDLDKLKKWNVSEPGRDYGDFKIIRNSPDPWAEIRIVGGSVLRLSAGWTDSEIRAALAPATAPTTRRWDLRDPSTLAAVASRTGRAYRSWQTAVNGPVEIQARDGLTYTGFARSIKFHAAPHHLDHVEIVISSSSSRSDIAKQAADVCAMLNIPINELQAWRSNPNPDFRQITLRRPDGAASVEIQPAIDGYSLSVQFDWP